MRRGERRRRAPSRRDEENYGFGVAVEDSQSPTPQPPSESPSGGTTEDSLSPPPAGETEEAGQENPVRRTEEAISPNVGVDPVTAWSPTSNNDNFQTTSALPTVALHQPSLVNPDCLGVETDEGRVEGEFAFRDHLQALRYLTRGSGYPRPTPAPSVSYVQREAQEELLVEPDVGGQGTVEGRVGCGPSPSMEGGGVGGEILVEPGSVEEGLLRAQPSAPSEVQATPDGGQTGLSLEEVDIVGVMEDMHRHGIVRAEVIPPTFPGGTPVVPSDRGIHGVLSPMLTLSSSATHLHTDINMVWCEVMVWISAFGDNLSFKLPGIRLNQTCPDVGQAIMEMMVHQEVRCWLMGNVGKTANLSVATSPSLLDMSNRRFGIGHLDSCCHIQKFDEACEKRGVSNDGPVHWLVEGGDSDGPAMAVYIFEGEPVIGSLNVRHESQLTCASPPRTPWILCALNTPR